ncbi:carbohydrate ABC transporter permease [Paenibacillus thalictri]|uniref:Carbohydrate ABC transporter permease n=1 Tax=Paenibacillus thalictri TaxID=2527873 RepID=A0A4V6MSD0_9BACL|nr:carbohydrate ABC transporter permease [Paenibacillus thalictri]TBL70514.1 carbohydrate ABC transporter permease [Paenibacillus thalictri]
MNKRAFADVSLLLKHIPLLFLAICCIAPLLLVVNVSFTDIQSIYRTGYSFLPHAISLDAYAYIFADAKQIVHSYLVTILVTAAGTALSLLVMAMIAYPLSRADFRHQRKMTFYVFFTMLFNGGLVPTYIVVTKYLHLGDSFWALILPYLVIPWYVLLLKTFFTQIPYEIIEASKVDGCSEYRIFFTILLPMTKPALATVGLMVSLRYWNDWWLSLLYINNENLVPLQLLLYRIMANIQELARMAAESGINETIEFPSESARMAMAIIAAGPMLFIFPFFQRYFVQGLTVGAVKG